MTPRTESRAVPLLDWAELRAEIIARYDNAGRSRGAAHWNRLVELIDDRVSIPSAALGPPVNGRRWWLTEIRVSGFRGFTDEVTLTLPPTAGVTVLHAPNGSGKSSVTEAIRAAVYGAPAASARRLWDPVDRAGGADRAVVEVVLHDGADELRCRWRDDHDPFANAEVLMDGVRRSVSVLDPDWQAALAAFMPVFAYGETQDRLGSVEELAQHLDALLALGPCFLQLHEDVQRRSQEAKAAVSELQRRKKSAQHAVGLVDESFRTDLPSALDPITFPVRFSQPSPSGWLQENDLDGDLSSVEQQISADDVDETRRLAERVVDDLDALDAAEAELGDDVDPRIVDPLVALHAAVQDDAGHGPCPVCGQESDWRTALAEVTGSLAACRDARASVQASAKELQWRHRDVVAPLLTVAVAAGMGADGALTTLEAAMPEGTRTSTDRARLRAVAHAVRSPEFDALVTELRARSDYVRRWRSARRAAVDDLVRGWHELGPDAASANDWTQSAKFLTTLRNDLAEERSVELAREIDAVFGRLLVDTPLAISAIDLRGDALQLSDANGAPRRLGTLSSGQRNALVLAPLLRTRMGGPFGFVIVDDPVHALDDLRIDLVADELLRLADDRRVVVLTHDSRFVEALATRGPRVDLRTPGDDPGAAFQHRAAPWAGLLDDADKILAQKDLPPELGRLPVAVRGLCRHALDGALRDFAFRWAVLVGRAASVAALAELDAKHETRERLTVAAGFEVPGHVNPVDAVRRECGSHLTAWNQASHDTGGDTMTGLTNEVAAARAACTILDLWGRA